MLIVPVNSTGDRTIQVLLGFHLLSIRTYWNSLVPGWFMDIGGPNGERISAGDALVPGVNILAYDPTIARIYGQFRIFCSSGANDTPTSLGNEAQLWWFEPGVLEEATKRTRQNPEFLFDTRAMYSPEADRWNS